MRPCERIRFEESDVREMLSQFVQRPAAAADNQAKRPLREASQAAQLGDMPVDTPTSAAPGGKLEGQDVDLRPGQDEVAPSRIVVFGPGIDMKRSREPGRGHLAPRQQNALHRVEIVRPWHVIEDAVIRRGDQRNSELAQTVEERRAVRKLPPSLDRRVLADAAQHDSGARGDKESRC
jgi:hypothetical protein